MPVSDGALICDSTLTSHRLYPSLGLPSLLSAPHGVQLLQACEQVYEAQRTARRELAADSRHAAAPVPDRVKKLFLLRIR